MNWKSSTYEFWSRYQLHIIFFVSLVWICILDMDVTFAWRSWVCCFGLKDSEVDLFVCILSISDYMFELDWVCFS